MSTEKKMIDLSKIRIDGGTQPRNEINEAVVSEYAEAFRENATFPPVVVFFDGTEYWLADGFHRTHAARHVGLAGIEAEVREGTRRDAVLYSVGANAAHGLRRTNADKRKAVLMLLEDAEWSQWSDQQIARYCAVSPTTVGTVRRSLSNLDSDEPTERTYTTKHGTTATMQTGNIGKRENAPQAVGNSQPIPTPTRSEEKPARAESVSESAKSEQVAACESCADLADQLAELAASLKETQEDNESMARVLEADDRVAQALSEAKRYREQNRLLTERINGLVNENAQYIRAAKKWQRIAEKAEKELKDAVAPAF